MKKTLALLLALCMIFALCACGQTGETAAPAEASAASTDSTASAAADTLTIQLAHADAETEDAIHHKMALLFKQYVDELSNGSIVIDIVGNGQLGAERDLVEGLQLGTIEMASTANMILSNFMPEFGVFDLPYVITNYAGAYKALDSDTTKDLIEKFASEKGVRILAYGQGGFRQVIGNKAVLTVDDMKGLKIRTPESSIYIDTFDALGASPTPLAWTETFTALQQKTVDAFEITPAVVYSNGFYEVCSDIAITNHLYSPNPFMISEELFQSLTSEQQQILQEAATKAALEQRAWIEASEEDTLKKLEENGMTVDYPEDLSAFQNAIASSGLYEKYYDVIGQDLIEAVIGIAK